jgi:hypothetical protein
MNTRSKDKPLKKNVMYYKNMYLQVAKEKGIKVDENDKELGIEDYNISDAESITSSLGADSSVDNDSYESSFVDDESSFVDDDDSYDSSSVNKDEIESKSESSEWTTESESHSEDTKTIKKEKKEKEK